MTNREYHLRELEIALAERDPNRLMPELEDGVRRVLDIGCGAGQTLIALGLEGRARGVGLDIDLEALGLGKEWLGGLHVAPVDLAAGSGERLPFRDGSFDLVMSRVALPYMHIPAALREVARVLAPGGRVWFALHPASMFQWWKIRSVRAAAYHLYIAANSLLFHWGVGQFRYPLNRRRTESFQTEAGMRKRLTALGFREVRFWRSPAQFVVSAIGPGRR